MEKGQHVYIGLNQGLYDLEILALHIFLYMLVKQNSKLEEKRVF